jgi:hypothetical protein
VIDESLECSGGLQVIRSCWKSGRGFSEETTHISSERGKVLIEYYVCSRELE